MKSNGAVTVKMARINLWHVQCPRHTMFRVVGGGRPGTMRLANRQNFRAQELRRIGATRRDAKLKGAAVDAREKGGARRPG